MITLDSLPTEMANERTASIDQLSTLDMLRLINSEDQKVAPAVERELGQVAKAVDAVYEAFLKGGRLVYCGCGTSGRLGVLDVVECLPIFSTGSGMVIAIMAGGNEAVFRAKEGADDSLETGAADIDAARVTEKDVVVGIAASGRTPYVIGALRRAREIGASTVSLSCNKKGAVGDEADIPISVDVGPDMLVVGGGGARNSLMMEDIRSLLPGVDVADNEALGHSSDSKEALAFAILASECVSGTPNNAPGATGAARPVVMGKITQ